MIGENLHIIENKGVRMKKVNQLIITLILLAGASVYGQQSDNNESEKVRQFIITNRTNGTLDLRVAVDGRPTAQFLLPMNEQQVILFKQAISLFQVGSAGVSRQSVGLSAPDYTKDVQAVLRNELQDNIEVTITSSGLLSGVRPYGVKVEPVKGFVATEQKMSFSGKLIDKFPLVAAARKANPGGPIVMTDILGSNTNDSFTEIVNNWMLKKEEWRNALAAATNAREAQFATNMIEIFDNAIFILLAENPLLRDRGTEKAGIKARAKETFFMHHPLGQIAMLPLTLPKNKEKEDKKQRLYQLLQD